tara:strand:+ start:406 stop:1419 length:1014 start_codon:yes stop_codon:yes gene_type:complete
LKKFLSILKVALPLAFGVFLIWYVFKDLSEQEKEELFQSMSQAKMGFILLSVLLGILSHMSRAVRWKYTIQPLGKTPSFWNSFFCVMIGYVANLALPRLGEVTRPALLGKYEGLPFNKLFGTIVAERVADLLILALIMASVIFMELDMLRDMLYNFLSESSDKFSVQNLLILGLVLVVGGALFFFLMLAKSSNPLFVKVRDLIKGIMEGVQSIIKMENKWYFILHTLFIWIMYVGMFAACFYSIEETASVPVSGIMAAFVMGSLAIVFVQGGLGVFPIAVMETLMLYGITKTSALAMGWIIWTSQTLMVIVFGVLSLALIRIFNNGKTDKSIKYSSE